MTLSLLCLVVGLASNALALVRRRRNPG